MGFAEMLIKFRADFNLSQNDVAVLLGVTQPTISLYELSKLKPTRKNELMFEKIIKKYESENA